VFGGVVLGSTVRVLPNMPPSPNPDPKALRSESASFATRARGSCGNNPGPVWSRIVTFPALSIGDWLYGVRKRVQRVRWLIFSDFPRQRFKEFTLCGGGTDLALIRPKKGSSVANVFEGIAPSSA
jgi:hypothetical protein